MKKIIVLLAVMSLTACGGDNNNESSSGANNGIFKATVGDKKYEVAVKCYSFDSDKFDTGFMFGSDNSFGNKDTDGDGITIRGDRIKVGKDKSPIEIDGISLDIVDHGVRYSADPAIAAMEKRKTWTKTANGITGTDILRIEGENDPGKTYSIMYEVVCN